MAGTAGRELEGKVALVTGAAQGIGLAIATELQSAGARIALVDLQQDKLDAAALALGGPEYARGYRRDLGDTDEAAGIVGAVAADFGRVDVVVNNAGRRGVYAFDEYPLEDWQKTMALNLTAPFLISQAAVRQMVPTGGGSIVNIASNAAILAFKNRSAYNASKAGVVMLTKSIALEFASRGIRCNAIAPGVIETDLNAAYLREGPESVAIVAGTPYGTWGQPADIAGAVRFLCSPGAGYINGVVLPVDGGWTTGKGY